MGVAIDGEKHLNAEQASSNDKNPGLPRNGPVEPTPGFEPCKFHRRSDDTIRPQILILLNRDWWQKIGGKRSVAKSDDVVRDLLGPLGHVRNPMARIRDTVYRRLG